MKTPPAARPDAAFLERLIAAAVRAPSGDNTQPWRFEVDAGSGRIDLFLDPVRDRSPINVGNRMARIACGAALENLIRAARQSGWEFDLRYGDGRKLAELALRERWGVARPGALHSQCIFQRVSNRRIYDGRPLPPGLLERLSAAVEPADPVEVRWMGQRERLPGFARLIAAADRTMFESCSLRDAFLANLRFGARTAEEGLPVATLELSVFKRLAMRGLPWCPNLLFRVCGLGRLFAAHARRLVESSSGLCLVLARDRSERTDLLVGRVMQRAWLALTEFGLAAQPMNTVPLLEGVLDFGEPGLVAEVGRRRAQDFQWKLAALCPEIGPARVAFIFRIGFAPPPTARAGRRALPAAMDSSNPSQLDHKRDLSSVFGGPAR